MLKERDEYEDRGTDGRITFNWISKKEDDTARNEYTRFMTATSSGVCLFSGKAIYCVPSLLTPSFHFFKYFISSSLFCYSPSFPIHSILYSIIISLSLPPSSLNVMCVSK
jgi:hypothetical protein